MTGVLVKYERKSTCHSYCPWGTCMSSLTIAHESSPISGNTPLLPSFFIVASILIAVCVWAQELKVVSQRKGDKGEIHPLFFFVFVWVTQFHVWWVVCVHTHVHVHVPSLPCHAHDKRANLNPPLCLGNWCSCISNLTHCDDNSFRLTPCLVLLFVSTRIESADMSPLYKNNAILF